MLDTTASDHTQAILDDFGDALAKGDIARATDMFEEDCYLQDNSFTKQVSDIKNQKTNIIICCKYIKVNN